MASPTPPEAPFDKAAHAWAAGMRERCDLMTPCGPLWARWALVEAFAAGKAAGKAEAAENMETLSGGWTEDNT